MQMQSSAPEPNCHMSAQRLPILRSLTCSAPYWGLRATMAMECAGGDAGYGSNGEPAIAFGGDPNAAMADCESCELLSFDAA